MTKWNIICIGYSMFCVGYGIYIRGSGAPECIFQNKHKTLYKLFSPDPALSCAADTQASHCEIYILCTILLHFIKEMVISILAMDAFTWDIWILLEAFLLDFFFFFFSKLSWKHFSDHTLQM